MILQAAQIKVILKMELGRGTIALYCFPVILKLKHHSFVIALSCVSTSGIIFKKMYDLWLFVN